MWDDYFRNASNDLPNWFTYYLQEKQGKLRMERVVDQVTIYYTGCGESEGIVRTQWSGLESE